MSAQLGRNDVKECLQTKSVSLELLTADQNSIELPTTSIVKPKNETSTHWWNHKTFFNPEAVFNRTRATKVKNVKDLGDRNHLSALPLSLEKDTMRQRDDWPESLATLSVLALSFINSISHQRTTCDCSSKNLCHGHLFQAIRPKRWHGSASSSFHEMPGSPHGCSLPCNTLSTAGI